MGAAPDRVKIALYLLSPRPGQIPGRAASRAPGLHRPPSHQLWGCSSCSSTLRRNKTLRGSAICVVSAAARRPHLIGRGWVCLLPLLWQPGKGILEKKGISNSKSEEVWLKIPQQTIPSPACLLQNTSSSYWQICTHTKYVSLKYFPCFWRSRSFLKLSPIPHQHTFTKYSY